MSQGALRAGDCVGPHLTWANELAGGAIQIGQYEAANAYASTGRWLNVSKAKGAGA